MAKMDVPSGRAISIRQPFVEQIFQGIKRYEYRSRPTQIRGRVYIYASSKPRLDVSWRTIKKKPEDLPMGMIVGSVEIIDCKYFKSSGDYGYKLKNPKRYKKHLKPKSHPQPCWFFPFGKPK